MIPVCGACSFKRLIHVLQFAACLSDGSISSMLSPSSQVHSKYASLAWSDYSVYKIWMFWNLGSILGVAGQCYVLKNFTEVLWSSQCFQNALRLAWTMWGRTRQWEHVLFPAFSNSFHHVLLPQYMKVCTHAQPVEILKKLKNLEHLHLQDLGIC